MLDVAVGADGVVERCSDYCVDQSSPVATREWEPEARGSVT